MGGPFGHASLTVDMIESTIGHDTHGGHTENLGFKNSVINCRLEKCMSSGSVCSCCFPLALRFLPLEPLPEVYFARVIPAPRVTGAKSSFAVSFRSFSAGDRKSILNASFFSRLGLEAAVASVAASAKQKIAVVSKMDTEIEKGIRTSSYSLA